MKNLMRIIGLAPSEMSDEELAKKLRKERERVTNTLDAFRQMPSTTRKTKSSVPKTPKPSSHEIAIAAEVLKACAELNISVEEFIERQKEYQEAMKNAGS